MRRSLLVFGLLLLAAASAQRPSPGPSVSLTPALGIAPRHTVADALGEPFPDTYTVQVPGAGPRTVHNCTDYLALGTAKVSTGSSLDDRTLLSLGVRCVALDWIRSAPTSTHAAAPSAGLAFGALRVFQLPPGLALTLSGDDQGAARKASEAGQSILAVEPDLRLRKGAMWTVGLRCPDWAEQLTLYARGDFLGTGDEQWLVRAAADATGGTYTSTRLFLLRPAHGGWVVARTYPPASGP